MAPTSIEQALVTLVPTINTLPPELVQLAGSLLVQSKSKAAHLKPEEEIGRAYACANIACERLKARLGLEKIQPRPPVPPRIYKKLYTFLDQALSVPATPRTQRQIDALAPASGGTPRSTRNTPRSTIGTPKTPSKTPLAPTKVTQEEETPSHRSEKRTRTPSAKLAENATVPIASTSRKRRKVTHSTAQIPLPKPVDAMVASLTTTFAIPGYGGDIMTGLRSILAVRGYDATSSTTPNTSVLSPTHLPGLLITLALYVSSALSGNVISSTDLERQKAAALSGLRDSVPDVEIDEKTTHTHISSFLAAAGDEDWLSGSWFEDLPSLETEADAGEEEEVVRAFKRGEKTPLRRKEKHAPRPDGVYREEEDSPAGLLPGLGTMFQDAVDWLGEERREGYREWERGIREVLTRTEEGPKGRKEGAKGHGKVRGMVQEIERRSASANSAGGLVEASR